MPAVSVIMGVYNVAGYVAAAVDSILAQTLTDFELIIIDDGSTDGTLEIVSGYRDPRIRLYPCAHRGMPFPLCHGIELAQAPYLTILDGDDVAFPRKLELHARFLDEHPEVDLTFSWSRIIDEHGHDSGLTSRRWHGPITFSQLLTDNVIGNASALVFRRQALRDAGGLDITLPYCHDWEAWLRIALLRPGNMCAVGEFLTYYRQRPGQMTSKIPPMEDGFERMVEKLRAIEPRQVAHVHRRARSNMRRFFAFRSYQVGRYAESLGLLGRSFAASPIGFMTERRSWEMVAATLAGLLLPPRWHSFLLRAALKATRA